METPEKVYKVLRKEQGELKSVYAGKATGFPQYKGVTYKEGEIARAPQGQQGLACYTDLRDAKNFLGVENARYALDLVIHEATSLGTKRGRIALDSFRKSSCTYPALLLGKQVYPEILVVPKFKIGDRVKSTGNYSDRANIGTVVGSIIAHQTGVGLWEVAFDGYRTLNCFDYDIALAPKEEWVDVTRECTLMLHSASSSWVAVCHNERAIMFLGDKPYNVNVGGYKVEFASGEAFTNGFRVYKRAS